jgi:integrase
MTRLPTGSLVITVGKHGPHYESKWRWQGRQHKRRLGPAWLDLSGDGWVKRAGRPKPGFLSREDAIVAMRAMIAAHALQNAEDRSQAASFSQVAERWFARGQRRGLKPSTLRLYRQMINAYVLDKGVYKSKKIPRACPFASKQVDLVSKADMRGWFDPIPYSPQKAKLLMAVKSICAFAVSEEWTRENVALAVECRALHTNCMDYEFFDHAEIKRLVAAADDEHDAALYATAAMTGLRKGELFGLRWKDVDFAGKRLVVRRNLTSGELGTPKNGHSRIVPLVPELSARLKEFKRKKLNPPGATVFCGHPDAVVKRYRKAASKARLRPLPFHGLRHSFGSHAVNVASLVRVRDWMGHSSLTTTGKYLHAKHLDSDAELLALAFSA